MTTYSLNIKLHDSRYTIHFPKSALFLTLFLLLLVVFPYPSPKPASAVGGDINVDANLIMGGGLGIKSTRYSDASNPLFFTEPAGTTVLNNLSASGSANFLGNVGIGTTVPGAALGINGNILFTNDADRTISVDSVTGTGITGKNLTITAGGAAALGNAGSLYLTGASGGVRGGSIYLEPALGSTYYGYVILADAGGNVGIGTTAPTQALDFGGSAANMTFSNTTGPHQILTGGTSDLALMPGGNIGIGTTAPSTVLAIAKDDAINNDITNLLTLTHTTSGTASSSNGFVPDTSGTLNTNLTSFWNLDETSGTRSDAKSSNDLTAYGSPGSAQGIRGAAADLNSASSQVLVKTDNAALSTGDIDFSISTWVRLSSKTATMTIVSKADSSSVREYELSYNTSSDRFNFDLFNSSGTSVCAVVANNFGAVATGAWDNIVVWHDATANTCNIKVNNGTADSANETGVASDTTANFRVGARYTVNARYFDGRVDATGFWKKVLSSTEITDLYNTGAGSERYSTDKNGIGSAVLFKNENDAGSAVNSGRITSYLTTVTGGSEASDMAFETRTAGQNLVKNMRLNATGDLYLNGSLNAQSNPDIAENIIVTDPSIEGGDIVMIDPTFIPPTNDNIYNNFAGKKSDEPYSQKLIGIISSNPGIILNATKGSVDTGVVSQENERPMAISGRVPVKISSTSPAINIGDPITASTNPGRGMKATQEGKIVGTALENWSPSNPTDKILVLISSSYYNPELNIGSIGDLVIKGSTTETFVVQNSKDNSVITRISAFAELVVGKIRAGIIETKKIIVDGVDILKKLNELSDKSEKQQQTIDSLQKQINMLEVLIKSK